MNVAPFDDLPGFDSMLARLSARLITLRPAEVDAAIDAAFGSIVEALDVDRCALLRLDRVADGSALADIHDGNGDQVCRRTRLHDAEMITTAASAAPPRRARSVDRDGVPQR